MIFIFDLLDDDVCVGVLYLWLCDGCLLRLYDFRVFGNMKVFEFWWKKGEVIVLVCIGGVVCY